MLARLAMLSFLLLTLLSTRGRIYWPGHMTSPSCRISTNDTVVLWHRYLTGDELTDLTERIAPWLASIKVRCQSDRWVPSVPALPWQEVARFPTSSKTAILEMTPTEILTGQCSFKLHTSDQMDVSINDIQICKAGVSGRTSGPQRIIDIEPCG